MRVDPRVLEALQRWANDDPRTVNAEMEFLLRRSLQQAGRLEPETRGRGSLTAVCSRGAPTTPPGSSIPPFEGSGGRLSRSQERWPHTSV